MLSHSGDIFKDSPKEQLGSFQLFHSLSLALQLSRPQLAQACPQLRVLNPWPLFVQTVKAGEIFRSVSDLGISMYGCTL